jgi:crossover junction endodeoxyribonuclease RuvC
MIYIGIDVGKDGAISILHENGEVESHLFSINQDRTYDLYENWDIFSKIKKHKGNCIITVEDVYCVGGSSAQATWSFSRGKAIIECFLVCLGFEYNLVKPKVWQKTIFAQFPKEMKDTKEKSISFVKENYPKCNLIPKPKRTPHDGIADAVCIAHYSKLNYYASV